MPRARRTTRELATPQGRWAASPLIDDGLCIAGLGSNRREDNAKPLGDESRAAGATAGDDRRACRRPGMPN